MKMWSLVKLQFPDMVGRKLKPQFSIGRLPTQTSIWSLWVGLCFFCFLCGHGSAAMEGPSHAAPDLLWVSMKLSPFFQSILDISIQNFVFWMCLWVEGYLVQVWCWWNTDEQIAGPVVTNFRFVVCSLISLAMSSWFIFLQFSWGQGLIYLVALHYAISNLKLLTMEHNLADNKNMPLYWHILSCNLTYKVAELAAQSI